MKVALFQFSSQLDYKENLAKIDLAAKEAHKHEAKALFLPECFYSFSDGKSITPHLVKWNNEHFKNIMNIAQANDIYLLGGSVVFEEDEKIFNRSVNFSNTGEFITHYDKINLFSINDPSITVDESKLYKKGKELKTFEIDQYKIGLNICFDLRFSDLAFGYKNSGCNILSYSSAFTYRTGKDHWEILLRARAIETQTFVIACNQCGLHNNAVRTYGHSMIIDPWGEVLSKAGDSEELIFANLDLDLVKSVKNRISMD